MLKFWLILIAVFIADSIPMVLVIVKGFKNAAKNNAERKARQKQFIANY